MTVRRALPAITFALCAAAATVCWARVRARRHVFEAEPDSVFELPAADAPPATGPGAQSYAVDNIQTLAREWTDDYGVEPTSSDLERVAEERTQENLALLAECLQRIFYGCPDAGSLAPGGGEAGGAAAPAPPIE